LGGAEYFSVNFLRAVHGQIALFVAGIGICVPFAVGSVFDLGRVRVTTFFVKAM